MRNEYTVVFSSKAKQALGFHLRHLHILETNQLTNVDLLYSHTERRIS